MDMDKFHFQQYRLTCHTARDTYTLLPKNFSDNFILWRGDHNGNHGPTVKSKFYENNPNSANSNPKFNPAKSRNQMSDKLFRLQNLRRNHTKFRGGLK